MIAVVFGCGFGDFGYGCASAIEECAIVESGTETGSGNMTGIVDFFDVIFPSFSHFLLSSSIYAQTLLMGPNCAW